jgi:hypothetical protein
MNANLLLERWRIGKRIESGGYLDYKFTVAESLVDSFKTGGRRGINRMMALASTPTVMKL